MSTAPPIEPIPAAAPQRRGCWKGALLGCGGGAVLLIVGIVALGWWVRRHPEAVTDLLMDSVRERYASDVTEPDKADLESAYSDFRPALEARRVSQADIDRIRGAVGLSGEVRRDEVVELTRIFREVGARAPRAAPGEAPPAAPAAATPVP